MMRIACIDQEPKITDWLIAAIGLSGMTTYYNTYDFQIQDYKTQGLPGYKITPKASGTRRERGIRFFRIWGYRLVVH